jgi:microcystin-dependent protein
MPEPFLGEIRLMSFNYAPKGWAMCNGQLLPINQNQPLFALLGTAYGGDGRTNFALPDLRGRTPIHLGAGRQVGHTGGEQAHTVSLAEMPTHVHFEQASGSNADVAVPAGNILASASGLYAPAAGVTTLEPSTVGNVGGSQAHLNMQPFLTLTFAIALQGIFPSQN